MKTLAVILREQEELLKVGLAPTYNFLCYSDHCTDNATQIRADVMKLAEALRFYADGKHFDEYPNGRDLTEIGEKAKQVLADTGFNKKEE